MNERVNRAGIISKTTEKLKDKKIVIGGNREKYKRKYHLQYTQEIVDNVLAAFMDTLGDIISNGDTTVLNGYMTIEPKYYKAKRGTDLSNNTILWPGGYKVKIKSGSKLKEACKKLNENENEQENDNT